METWVPDTKPIGVGAPNSLADSSPRPSVQADFCFRKIEVSKNPDCGDFALRLPAMPIRL